MLLLKNTQEREQQTDLPPLGWLCVACNENLEDHYPVLFVDDRNRTGYHLACAAQLAATITDTLADYLQELDQLDAMSRSFRKAVSESQEGKKQPSPS